jgi:uncharacterized phage protein (TIGR02218 family)
VDEEHARDLVIEADQLHERPAVKNAPPAMLTAISTGQTIRTELYDFMLLNGQVYHFTGGQIPLPSVQLYLPNGVVAGPYSYVLGDVLVRSDIKQKVGTDGGSMKLTVVTVLPTLPGQVAPTFNGYPFIQAVRNGFFDGATVRMSEIRASPPMTAAATAAAGIFMGTIEDITVGRFMAEFTVNDFLVYMNTQQMPRNVFKAACGHTLFDAGCSLLKSTYTVTGTVGSSLDGAHFDTNLTAADHYYELGTITMTGNVTAALAGSQGSVSSYLHANGAIVLDFPFAVRPAVGDTFSIYPGCDLQRTTCSSKFNNLAHYMGEDFIPDPSTVVDGNTQAPSQPSIGAQAGQIISSTPTGTGKTTSPYKT